MSGRPAHRGPGTGRGRPGGGLRELAPACLALAVAACGGMDGGADDAAGDGAPALSVLFRVDSLSGPESVAWDAARQRWLVTNSAGGAEGEGSGFVTAVSAGGDAVVRRAYGAATPGLRLDAPRGLAVRGDRAYVADLRRVVALDLAGDSTLWVLEVAGSGRLDDVALDPSGAIYVSDSGGDVVWRVAADGSGARRVGAAGSLRGPNGLLLEGGGGATPGRLLVAAREGAVLALDPDSSVTLVAGSPEFGELDGLQAAPDGGLLVSDGSGGRIHHLGRREEGVWQAGVAWLSGLDRPTDMLVRDSVLAVPEAGADRVTFYRIGRS